MSRRAVAVLIALLAISGAGTRADVGEPASSEITRVQASKAFARVPSVHGWMPEVNLERWKFVSSNVEQRIFAVDAKHYGSPVVRETYIRETQLDPYSLRPGQATGREDLVDVLSPREYNDYQRAASIAAIAEEPLHTIAYFYRGTFAAYETIEPSKRAYGSPDRFEWRSFPRAQLAAAMKAARACDNGPDCAAW
jgi:hypothetical protein